MTTLLLIHGGLWEEHMDSEAFWHRPGIVAGLQRHGLEVLAPNRRHRAPDWNSEVDHLAPILPDLPVTVVAGSNGCSVAIRLVLAFPDRVSRLLLAWPATACNPAIDARTRNDLTELGASDTVIDTLLAGQTLRGVSDAELAAITMPVGILPAVPETPFHQRRTVDALRSLMPHADQLPGSPEPPRPDSLPHTESFLKTVTRFAAS